MKHLIDLSTNLEVFRTLINNSPDLFLIYEGKSIITEVVAGDDFHNLMPIDSVKNKKVEDIILSQEISSLIIEGIQKAKTSGQKETIFFDLKVNNKTRYYEERFIKINESKVLGIVRDLTNLKEKEIALNNYTEQLNNSNEQLQRIIFSISHDLKEPVRSIVSFSELLLNKNNSGLTDKQMHLLHYLNSSGVKLHKRLNGLLDFVKLEDLSNKSTLVDTNNILEEVKANIASRIHENNAIIQSEDLPNVYFVEQYLIQVFQNIISNSIKYSKSEEQPFIKISSEENSISYIFKIEDNGIGIPKEHQTKIFDMFTKLHHSDEYEGIGFGLAISKQILLKMGGDIWVEAELNKGSSFYFTVPKVTV